MTWTLVSILVLMLSPLLIGGIDVVLELVGGNSTTLSRVCLTTSRLHPGYLIGMCYLFGVLCGHLFNTIPENVRPLPMWFSFIAFVVVPFLFVMGFLFTGLRLSHLPGGEFASQAAQVRPLASVLIWLIIGAIIGGTLLAQTAE